MERKLLLLLLLLFATSMLQKVVVKKNKNKRTLPVVRAIPSETKKKTPPQGLESCADALAE